MQPKHNRCVRIVACALPKWPKKGICGAGEVPSVAETQQVSTDRCVCSAEMAETGHLWGGGGGKCSRNATGAYGSRQAASRNGRNTVLAKASELYWAAERQALRANRGRWPAEMAETRHLWGGGGAKGSRNATCAYRSLRVASRNGRKPELEGLGSCIGQPKRRLCVPIEAGGLPKWPKKGTCGAGRCQV